MTCKEVHVLSVRDFGENQVPSILVKKFNELFPNKVKENGGNLELDRLLSIRFIEDAYGFDLKFKKEGDPGYDTWKKNMDYFEQNNLMHRFYAETGEPVVYSGNGAVWFIDRNGKRDYVVAPVIPENERLELISALSYRMLSEGSDILEPSSYVKNYFNEQIDSINDQLDEMDEAEDNGQEIDTVKYDALDKAVAKLKKIKANTLAMKSIILGVTNSVKEYNIQYSEELILDEELTDESMGIEAYIKDSTQVSDDSTLDPEIKRLLNSVIDFEYTKDGFIDRKESIFGLSLPQSQNQVKNKILGLVSNIIEQYDLDDSAISPYDLMIEKLRELAAKGDESLRRFLVNLDSIYNTKSESDKLAFRVKFFKSFYKGSHTFVLTEVSEKDGALDIKRVNPDNSQNKSQQVTMSFAMGMIAADKSNLTDKLFELEDLIDENVKVLNPIKITEVLNSIGLDVSLRAVKDMIENESNTGIYSGPKGVTLRSLLSTFPDSTYNFTEDNKEVTMKFTEIIRDFHKLKNKGSALRELTDDSTGSFLHILGTAEAKFRDDLADSNYNIAGKSTWKYTLMSHINREILDWKNGNISKLRALEHKRIPLVDYLLYKRESDLREIKDYTPEYIDQLIAQRIAKLNLVTNAQLRDKERDNTVEHKKIGEGDLVFDMMYKMFASQDIFYEKVDNMTGYKQEFFKNRAKDMILNLFNADKGGSYGIEGIDGYNINSAYFDGNKMVLGDGFTRAFVNLFKGELDTIQRHSDLIGGYFNIAIKNNKGEIIESGVKARQKYLLDNFVPDVHYLTAENKQEKINLTIDGISDYYEALVSYKFDPTKPESEGIYEYDEVRDDEGVITGVTNVRYTGNKLTKNMVDRAGWNTFGFFNSLMNENADIKKKMFASSPNDDYSQLRLNYEIENLYVGVDDAKPISDLIADHLLQIADRNYDYFKKMIGNNITNTQTSIDGSDNMSFAYNFILQNMINNMSIFQTFNGDLHYFKQKPSDVVIKDLKGDDIKLGKEIETLSMEDALKRGPATMTDGLGIYNESIEGSTGITATEGTYKDLQGNDVSYNPSTHFVISIMNNTNYNNSKHDFLIEMGVKASQMLNPKAKKGYKNYAHEIGDAQGYASPASYKAFVAKVYGWTDKDSEHFENLMDPDYIPTYEDFKWLKQAGRTTQGMKLVGYGHKSIGESGLMFPYFIKYAPLPLFPALTAGTEIDKLRQKMENDGIDQVIFKSGSKSANLTATTIHKTSKEGTFDGLTDIIELNPFTVEYNKFKWQVELPAHFDSENTIGTQHLKNLIGNLDLKSDKKVYPYRGEMLTAKQMFDVYQNAIVSQLKSQGRNFLEKYNIKFNPDGSINYNSQEIRDLLISQMDIVADYDLINVLMDTNNPLETVPGVAQRLFPILSGFIHKKVGKVRTNTGSAIQVANVGFDRILDIQEAAEEGRVAFLNNDTEIKPPVPITVTDLKEFEFKSLEGANDELKDLFSKYKTLLNKPQRELSNEDMSEINELKSKLNNYPVYYHSVNGSVVISLQKELTTTNTDGTETITEGHLKINKAKIMLPFASIKKKLGMSYEDLVAAIEESRPEWEQGRPGRIDRRIFENLISYRIPNQAISSNDAVEIVGILPEIYGDTGIVYHEITAKAGSDFDVDKLYLMLPSFGMKSSYQVAQAIQNEVIGIIRNSSNTTIKPSDIHSLSVALKGLLDDINIENDFAVHELNKLFRNDKLENLRISEEILDFAMENMDKYTSDKEGNHPLLKAIYSNNKINSKDIVYTDNNSTKGLQNNVVEVMQSILQSEVTYDDLMSPLDSDLLKDTIVDVMYEKYVEVNKDSENIMSFKEFDKARKLSPMDQMSPMRLIKSRVDMLQAKQLVATMANHMTDVPFTQIQGMRVLVDLGFGSSDLSKIDMDEYSYMVGDTMTKEDYYKITQLVSYFMNAAVDAAKDNYIIDGNFIGYTSGAAMLLIRGGMHPREVFRLLLDPDILRLTAFKSAQTGVTSGIRLSEYGYDTDTLEGYSFQFLQEKLSSEWGNQNFSSYKGMMDAFENSEVNTKDLKLGLWNLLVEAGKELNNDIATSKADSNGGGKNIYEHIAILNKMEQQMGSVIGAVREDGTLTVLNKLYKDGLTRGSNELSFDFIHPNDPRINDLTMFGAMSNFSLNLIHSLAKGMFIEATDGFRYMVNEMNGLMGTVLDSNADNIKRTSRILKTYLLGTSGFELYNIDKDDAVNVLKNAMQNLEALQKNPRTKNNEFIKLLTYNNQSGLIEFPNFKKFNSVDKARIADSFNKLYDLNIVLVTRRLNDLVKYAFVTTNFSPTRYSFNEYIPKAYFTDRGHGYFINNLMDKLNNQTPEVFDAMVDDAISMMASYNPTYFRLVKNLHTKKTDSKTERVTYSSPDIQVNKPITDEKVLKAVTKKGKFLPFVKTTSSRTEGKGSDKVKIYTDHLFKLVNIEDGNPVYIDMLIGNPSGDKSYMVPGEFINNRYLGKEFEGYEQLGIKNINIAKNGENTYDYKSPVVNLFGELPIPGITKSNIQPNTSLKKDHDKEQRKLIKKLIPLLPDTMEINGQEVTGIQEKVTKIMASKAKTNIEVQEMFLMATDADDLQSRVEQHLKCN